MRCHKFAIEALPHSFHTARPHLIAIVPRRASLGDVVWASVPKAKDYHADDAMREIARMVLAVQQAEARARQAQAVS